MNLKDALLIALVLASPGCDDRASNDDPPEDLTDGDETGKADVGDETGAFDIDVEASIVAAHVVGSQIVSEGDASAQLAAQAVEFATVSVGSGNLVTTGTVRQQGSQYTYEASPGDALVVELDDAPTATFRIRAMEGNFESASAFLAGDHEFRFRVEVDEQSTLELGSVRSGSDFETSATGTMVVEGLDLELDVRARGITQSDVDSTGSRYHNAFDTTGTVTGSAFELHLDERWEFELVTASGDSAQSAVRTIANDLKVGDDDYAWVDVRTQKSYRNGRPSELDTYWTARGLILRNGQPFGEYRLDVDLIDENSGGFVLFVLDLPGGSYELERLPAY